MSGENSAGRAANGGDADASAPVVAEPAHAGDRTDDPGKWRAARANFAGKVVVKRRPIGTLASCGCNDGEPSCGKIDLCL